MNLIRNILADTAGTSSVEYAMIATVISLAALVGVQSLGAGVTQSYEDTTQKMADTRK